MNGLALAVTGVTGVGKAKVIDHLAKTFNAYAPITQVMDRRRKESGKPVLGTTKDNFERLSASGEVFCVRERNDATYGFSQESLNAAQSGGRIPVFNLMIAELGQFRACLPEYAVFCAYVIPSSLKALRGQLQQYGNEGERIFDQARDELSAVSAGVHKGIDFKVVNINADYASKSIHERVLLSLSQFPTKELR